MLLTLFKNRKQHYFVRSGYILIQDGVLRHAGVSGYGWSSRNASNVWGAGGLGAYYLEFNTGLNPSRGPGYRWCGFPLRCLSTAVD